MLFIQDFYFFGLLFLIFLLTIPYIFSMGFRSGEFAGQSSTLTPWSFNQLLVLLAVWAGAKSCWKMKSASLKSWSEEGSSPKFLNWFFLTILIRLWFSRLVEHLFLPHFFLPLNFLLTCLDTALCEQPASLVMNVCGLLSLWMVSMIVFWTTVRSAVFLMIVYPSEPNWDHFEGSGNLCRCFELISWLSPYSNLLRCELVGFC